MGKTGEDTRIRRKAVRGSRLENLYKFKGIDESKVLAETDTTKLLKTKKGNKVISKRNWKTSESERQKREKSMD